MNSSLEGNKTKFEFLINEYSFLVDYLKYNYDERDKYIQFYIGALTAVAAVVGFAINKKYWEIVLILAILNTVISYFVLLKVLFQRVVVTEYKNHLNLTRGALLKLAGGDPEVKKILLPTDATVKYLKTSGGDAAILRILETITAFSLAIVLFLIPWRYSGNFHVGKWLGVYLASATFFLVLIFLERYWKNILREKDKLSERRCITNKGLVPSSRSSTRN